LFTHSYHLRLDPKQLRVAKPYPPLGTLIALAAVRARGHEVALHDAQFAAGAADLRAPLERFRPDVLVVYDDDFNWLTKMCLSVMEIEALAMIGLARAAGCRVVVRGSDASDHRARYLEAGAEAVLLGDGELTLVELLDAFAAGRPVDAIRGLAWREGGQVRDSGRRPTPPDLDVLPSPAWDAVDLSPYAAMWRRRHGLFSLNLASSRGCPYGCNWCAKPLFGRQYFVHSPARLADEIARVRALGAGHVWFGDDIFGLTAEWAGGLAEAVQSRGVRTPFMAQTRADLMIKDDLRRGLVRAGLHTAWLGAESGSQKILDAMDKGLRVEETREAVAKLRDDGVRVGLFLQYGYLGETRADIDATLRLVEDVLPDEIGVSVSYPLPGTPFFEQVKAQLGPKTNWTDSADLDLLRPGPYNAADYRLVHHYTHMRFRARHGLRHLRALLRAPWRATRTGLRGALSTAYFAPAAVVDALRLRRLV
jgi:radical SAM superfamily enzyme YgiQ (UPF0313 family)